MKNLIDEIEIKNVNELFKLISGEGDIPDLREDFIFRGVCNKNYELIPSAHRKNWFDEYNDSDFKYLECHQNSNEITIIAHNPPLDGDKLIDNEVVLYPNHKQFLKENYLLTKFINYADKSGLKLSIDHNIRKQIDSKINIDIKRQKIWPNPDYFEVISLAQHYDLPTCGLDWTYDYKVALYFLSCKILEKDSKDGCLWAFNYDKFLTFKEQNYDFHLEFYRPEYNHNHNLKSQKGLLTFWVDDLYKDKFNEPLNVKLDNEFKKSEFYKNENGNHYKFDRVIFSFKDDNEKLFYKFIIPNKLKAKILNELYLEGYSEEFLFPGFGGVVESIKNKSILDKILNKL